MLGDEKRTQVGLKRRTVSQMNRSLVDTGQGCQYQGPIELLLSGRSGQHRNMGSATCADVAIVQEVGEFSSWRSVLCTSTRG